jgi:hypothetical protein
MLLRHRPPGLDVAPTRRQPGFEHLEARAVDVLRWLNANRVDYVVIGPVAYAIRGDTVIRGPVAIVPAPYGRNFERLTRALVSQRAGLRAERGLSAGGIDAPSVAVRLTAEKLARGRRWQLRFAAHDLDIEIEGREAAAGSAAGGAGGPGGAPAAGVRYQDLLYEANRVTIADGLTVEVASLEDLEHFAYARRSGTAPEFRVSRMPARPAGERPAPDSHTA